MIKPLFRFLVPSLALLAQACGGAQKTPETAVNAGAATTATAPANPPKPLPAPNPNASPVQFHELCRNHEVSDSQTWSDKLAKARKLDDELKKHLDTSGLTDLAKCTTSADELDSTLEQRHIAAGYLCDLRTQDGGEARAAFNASVERTRAGLHQTLDAARKEQRDKQACIRQIAASKQQVEAFIDSANEQCSPRGDEALAQCDAKAQKVCDDYRAGHATPASVAEALQCNAASRAPMAAPDNARAASSASSRSPLTGAALQTAILTGAADFFVERAEQEISLFAAEVLSRKLCEQESPARPFLPRTCDLLMPCPKDTPENAKPSCDPEDPVLGATPAALRAAAQADLEAFPERLADAVATKDKDAACAVAFAWGVSEEVIHGADLAEVLKDPSSVLERPFVAKHCADHKSAIEALAAYIKAHLTGDPVAVADTLRSGDPQRLVSLDAGLAGNEAAKKAIAGVLRRLVELDRAVASYRQNSTPEARARLVIAAVQVTVPVMIYIAPKAEHDVFTVVDFFSQLLNREYATAVVTASQLEILNFMPANARNLVSLAASLAQAESSDDVRQTLKDAALPLGSWRRKNEPRWGATLTGMVGYTLGREHVVEEPATNREVRDGWTVAPALLVGVDLHHGLSSKTRFGVHVNVLDLGALGSIRTSTPEVENEKGDVVKGDNEVSAKASPDVRLEQVFAPGVFPYFGLGPFNVGPTFSFVPSLRPAQTATGNVEPLNVIRYGLALVVDVSVLPLF